MRNEVLNALFVVLSVFIFSGCAPSRSVFTLEKQQEVAGFINACKEISVTPLEKHFAVKEVLGRRVMCVSGNLGEETLEFLQANSSSNMVLVINSLGGDFGATLDAAPTLREFQFTLVVDRFCVGPCANYIFFAAKERVVLESSVVGWNGAFPKDIDQLRVFVETGQIQFWGKTRDLETEWALWEPLSTKQTTFYNGLEIDESFIFMGNRAHECAIRSVAEINVRESGLAEEAAKSIAAFWTPSERRFRSYGFDRLYISSPDYEKSRYMFLTSDLELFEFPLDEDCLNFGRN